jgi:hypothetical protein
MNLASVICSYIYLIHEVIPVRQLHRITQWRFLLCPQSSHDLVPHCTLYIRISFVMIYLHGGFRSIKVRKTFRRSCSFFWKYKSFCHFFFERRHHFDLRHLKNIVLLHELKDLKKIVAYHSGQTQPGEEDIQSGGTTL